MIPTLTVSKRLEFAASHRLYLPQWNAEKNWEHYGPDSQGPYGHGHNFSAYFGFQGPIDPETGMVVELSKLKARLTDRILHRYDHYFLNDLPQFSDSVPTIEHIAHTLFKDVVGEFTDTPYIPTSLQLIEDPSSSVIIEGSRIVRQLQTARGHYHLSGPLHNLTWDILPENQLRCAMMDNDLALLPGVQQRDQIGVVALETPSLNGAIITCTSHFCATHFLQHPQKKPAENTACYGKCHRPHGHRFEVLAQFHTSRSDGTALRQRFDAIIHEWDYQDLTSLPEFSGTLTSIEHVINGLWNKILDRIHPDDGTICYLHIDETPNNRFILTYA